jgi:hypothetical protein
LKRFRFYAAHDDLVPVLQHLERAIQVAYVPYGPDRDIIEGYSSWSELPSLGVSSCESAVGSDAFIVAPVGVKVVTRPIRLSTDEVVHRIDQLANPDTVVLRPGGIWRETIVLYGTFETAYDSEVTKPMLSSFEKGLRNTFRKVKAYWVGPAAFRILERGGRLTLAEQSHSDVDLKLSS